MHPDKCKDVRAKDAFYVVESAYKTLKDEEKRKVYLRIMREAKERTEYERAKVKIINSLENIIKR